MKKVILFICILLIGTYTHAEEEEIQIEQKLLPSHYELQQLKREEYHKKIKEMMVDSFKYGAMFKDSLGKYYTNGRYKFELTGKKESADPLFSHVEYKMSEDANYYKPYSHPISLSEEGEYKIIFRGIDKLNNISEDKIYNIIVDTTPPKVKYRLIGKHHENDGKVYYKPGVKIEVTADDETSGVFEILLNIENKDRQKGDNTFKGLGNLPYSDSQKEFSDHGLNTVYVRAFDRVMNLSQKKEISFLIDGEGPNRLSHKISPDTREINGINYCFKDSKLFLKAEDEGSGVYLIQYSFDPDKDSWKDYKGKLIIEGKEAVYKVHYRAMDQLGNISKVSEFSCNLDLVPPKSTIHLIKNK